MEPRGVVLFDGDCGLCSRAVRAILERDPEGRFQFAALQSSAAQRLLAAHAQQAPAELDSLVLLQNGRLYTQSAAALRIAGQLHGPLRCARVLLAVPRPLRDAVYRWVARNRLRWFGGPGRCALPGPSERSRFL